MGKLNIAHHKSYHPYRRDNIERVRRDEAEAALDEAAKEAKVMLADADARMDALRARAGAGAYKGKERAHEEEESAAGPSGAGLGSGAHINLFEEFEKKDGAAMLKTVSKKTLEGDQREQGIPLAPPEKDRTPWYSDKRPREANEDRRRRDQMRKSVHDPLTSINQQLARLSDDPRPPARSKPRPRDGPPQVAERLSRESTERQRALELIARRRREAAGSATPSTVRGGMDGAYGDQYNAHAVEEAHQRRGGGGGGRRW
ncbi:hypothetical protein PHLGIDRAFT_256870 [Phlebiopsis gigantea 11061_1 CR5-6]|uniref:CBF1-interacting co-repressor CIR N-terminal domain-containing protein n=1 Tax=Phlebiopsis gigantea (strain 11061_1 CR5-6) TaxID=745531 RepID=A0A0C3S4M4_PHLG1|nr:hypothetical protein PHLGIDRAFT_256870 [Phlebiopsis gigantea 11061_1 CR5-6]